jgi:hypothetical protein
MEIIIGMWNTRMTRWLGWKITRSRDHRIRTCQGCGVAYCTPITFLVQKYLDDNGENRNEWVLGLGSN